MINIIEASKNIPDIKILDADPVLMLAFQNNGFIAGGFMRRAFKFGSVQKACIHTELFDSDIDIFFVCQEDHDKFLVGASDLLKRNYKAEYAPFYQTKYATNFTLDYTTDSNRFFAIKVQVINFFRTSLDETLHNFDIANSMIAYSGCNKLHVSNDFLAAESARTIDIRKYTLMTARRLMKYFKMFKVPENIESRRYCEEFNIFLEDSCYSISEEQEEKIITSILSELQKMVSEQKMSLIAASITDLNIELERLINSTVALLATKGGIKSSYISLFVGLLGESGSYENLSGHVDELQKDVATSLLRKRLLEY